MKQGAKCISVPPPVAFFPREFAAHASLEPSLVEEEERKQPCARQLGGKRQLWLAGTHLT